MPGEVVALFLNPEPHQVVPVTRLEAHANHGIVGDTHYGKRTRQALLIGLAELEELGIEPGALREQITVQFPELQSLPKDTTLRVGSAEFTIEGPCEPCSSMAARLGEDSEIFKARTRGRRGMLARVSTSGVIEVGSEVSVVS